MKSLVEYINDSMLKHIAIELKDYDIIYEKYGEYNGCDELATYITNATYKLDNDVIDLDVSKLNIENTHFVSSLCFDFGFIVTRKQSPVRDFCHNLLCVDMWHKI